MCITKSALEHECRDRVMKRTVEGKAVEEIEERHLWVCLGGELELGKQVSSIDFSVDRCLH